MKGRKPVKPVQEVFVSTTGPGQYDKLKGKVPGTPKIYGPSGGLNGTSYV